MSAEFLGIVERIRRGESYRQDELIPYLCREALEERRETNAILARSFMEAGDWAQARVFADRAWLLSGFDPELLPLYEKILVQQGDLDALREAFKRAGMRAALSEGVGAALPLFSKSMYVYACNGKGDFYRYDFDVLQELDRMADPFRCQTLVPRRESGKRKIRIAYLVFGATHANSVIVKILKSFGEHYDREAFEIAFFIPENETCGDFDYCVFQKNILSLSSTDAPVYVTDGRNLSEQLFSTARQIHDYRPDILVTSALLADLKQYFIAALRPAAVIIGLTSGPPQQYSAPLLDWSISWDPHALMDCLSGCSQVSLQVDLPVNARNSALRSRYQIPADAVVLLAAGRPSKFSDESYWDAIEQVLVSRPNAFLVVVGLTVMPPFLDQLLCVTLKEQVKIFGWIDNYTDLVAMADIMIDTYPSGGGVTLMDAMAIGIPTVSFQNNFMRLFDQTDWSPGEWIIDTPELIAGRYQLDDFAQIVERLVDDQEFRSRMGAICREKALQRTDPAAMVKKAEGIYQKVVSAKLVCLEHDLDGASNVAAPSDHEAYGAVQDGRVNRLSYESYIFNKKELRLAKDICNHKFLYPFIAFSLKAYRKMLSIVLKAHA